MNSPALHPAAYEVLRPLCTEKVQEAFRLRMMGEIKFFDPKTRKRTDQFTRNEIKIALKLCQIAGEPLNVNEQDLVTNFERG